MGGNGNEPAGPDLRDGVDLGAIPDGGVLLGHAGEDAVLLYRTGVEVTAVGATCTHYSGPLAEGVVDGDTVRCPWHHACFSLRSGEVLRAPALNPLPRWKVHREGEVVRVGEKVEAEPYAGEIRQQADGPARVVIVGFGAAGSSAVETLLREGWQGRIDVVDPDPDAPYDRPNLSKDYLAGTAQEEWIPLRPAGWYEEHGVTVHRVEAASLDPESRRVSLTDGGELPYDALLVATGAFPIRLELPADPAGADPAGTAAGGRAVPPVLYLRSLGDSRAVIGAAEAAASGGARAVVLGASFIGLEVAASLRARGVEVDVVAPEAVPLERVMGQALGERIRHLHEEHGVHFHLGRTVTSRLSGGVVLDDGTRLEASFVVAGVGVRPALALAKTAGVEAENGVLVDDRMRTSVPAIWAAGDIARYPDRATGERIRVEHWVVAQRQGAAAALDMIGRGAPYGDAPFFWSQHYDVPINYVGYGAGWDDVRIGGDVGGGDCAVAYRRDGRVVALATIFRDDESLRAELSMERGEAVNV